MSQIATEFANSRFASAYVGDAGRNAGKPGFFARMWARFEAAQMEKAQRYLDMYHPLLARHLDAQPADSAKQ
jgi:hypothetical protein